MLPNQKLLRTVIQGSRAEDPHTQPAFRELTHRRLSGGDLECELCGWRLDSGLLQHYIKDACTYQVATSDGTDVKESNDSVPSGGLFVLDHIDFDHSNNSPENLRVVCEPCHHSQHIAMPNLVLGGSIGLLNTMSQKEVITLWRTTQMLVSENHPHAKRISALWSSVLSSGATTMSQSVRATPGREQALVTPQELGYWLAYIDEAIYSRTVVVLPDLRFFPSENALFATTKYFHWLGAQKNPPPAPAAAPPLVAPSTGGLSSTVLGMGASDADIDSLML